MGLVKPLSVPNKLCLSVLMVLLVLEGNCFILGTQYSSCPEFNRVGHMM